MKKKSVMRGMALLLALTLGTSSIMTGCGKKKEDSASTAAVEVESTQSAETIGDSTQEEVAQASSSESTVVVEDPEESATEETTEDAEAKAEEERKKAEEEARLQAEEEERKKAEEDARIAEEKKLAEQKNSFSMMYYLAITAEEIRSSKDNRLMLDEIYTSLLNDINPGSIDEITQDHLKNLRDIIKSYIKISTKRERLQYIYNQNKAAAIRSAVPNPLAILSVSNAYDWKKLALTVAYTAVDSYNNYKSASANADKEFLMSGWDLDDEEVATVQKNRDRAFDYMVDMVQEYDLDGLKTLNEEAITKFAEICAIESIPERIRRLESEEKTYSLLGNYWLELASCYFENDQYEKCLKSVDKYNELSTGIYRKDFNYVQILPKAIVAAQQTYSGDLYNSTISSFADAIMDNTEISAEDWSIRYFAAQTYLDLYSKTNKQEYLEKAYQIAYDNATVLLSGQRQLNKEYLRDVKENYATVEEPDYNYMTADEKKEKKQEYKDEKAKAEDYNDALKEARKTELPALYEPLVVNCELLFALAEKMNISDSDKADIEAILKTESNGIFLSKPINDAYSFTHHGNEYGIEISKDKITIPAELLTANAKITVSITQNGSTETIDDCTVSKVERKGTTIDTFVASLTSKTWDKHTWSSDSKVTINIVYNDAYDKSLEFHFAVYEYQSHWYGDKVVFRAE